MNEFNCHVLRGSQVCSEHMMAVMYTGIPIVKKTREEKELVEKEESRIFYVCC